jgi:hypothetical protein
MAADIQRQCPDGREGHNQLAKRARVPDEARRHVEHRLAAACGRGDLPLKRCSNHGRRELQHPAPFTPGGCGIDLSDLNQLRKAWNLLRGKPILTVGCGSKTAENTGILRCWFKSLARNGYCSTGLVYGSKREPLPHYLLRHQRLTTLTVAGPYGVTAKATGGKVEAINLLSV